MKTLGICIPTYKRPEFLKSCILSAIKYSNNIPIKFFVVDDSLSNVNTNVIEELSSRYDFISYKKNTINLGIDKNIQEVVNYCDCDYAWLIGEDDLFLPGSIERVYNLIQKTDFNFVFSNYAYSNENHTELLNNALQDIGNNRIPLAQFIENHLWAVGFIGACVIKKEAWIKTIPEPYESTYYTHVGRIVDMISGTKEVFVLTEPGVANRSKGVDTFTWKKDSFGVFLGFENMCSTVGINTPDLSQHMKKATEKFRAKIGYFSVKTLLRLRAEQAYDNGQYRKYIVGSELGKVKKACFYMVSIMPPVMLKPFLNLYIKLSRN